MDRKTREHFHGISAKDWKDLGYDEIPRPCTLGGKIHPIFANHHKEDRGFVGTDEEYALIMPALQLASRYLYSPRSCMFLYSIVFAERKTVPSSFSTEGHTIKIGRLGLKFNGGAWTEFSKISKKLYCPKKMDHIWRELAKYNHFSAGATEENDGETYPKPQDGADLQGDGRRGIATQIMFNAWFYKDIRRLQRKGLDNSHQMLNLQFHLAIVLCHEVAHAVNFASQSKLRSQMANSQKYIIPSLFLRVPPEPFLEEQTIAEIGYAWENEVLGGRLKGPPRHCPEELSTISDWPNGEPCTAHGHGSVPIRGKKQKSTLKAYIVDMQYIPLAFREEFWENWATLPTKHRGQALKIPRTLGYEYKRRTKEKSGHSSKRD